MRKFGFLAGLITALGISLSAYALGTGDGYYITFDDFAMINTSNSNTTLVSPYDFYGLGGGGQTGTFSDVSTVDNVEAKRDFNRTDGLCTIELCFTSKALPEGATLNYKCGDVDAISFLCEKGKLYTVSAEGKTELYDDNGFYGIKMLADIDKNTYSVQSNGITLDKKFTFLNAVDYIDNFYISTTNEGTGMITLEVMRISKDFSINEWFITSRSNVPDDWRRLGGGTSLVRMNSSLLNDRYSLEINDTDFTEETGISHKLSYDSDELWLEYQFFLPQQVKDFGATLESGGNDVIRFGTKNLDYGYWLNGKFTPVYTLRTNLWYHAMLKVTNEGTKLYINHKLMADNIPVKNVKIDNIRYTVGKTAKGTVYIDDIIAKAMKPLPDDYVPAPVKPEKKNPDTIVGMQSCNLWREGTHFGWDSIAAFPERVTYLGFYDEGSSEVKDWETKWMAEHGIDVEIYCWYRQSASNSEPIKRPRNSFALHDGYFNSEYSDQIKFIISWENAGRCGGPKDFEENMVPYWIEQYFKDDRYLKIDNKPVVGMYMYEYLIKDFGSPEGIKKEIDYLRNECIKAGFDGIELIMTSGTSNKSTLSNIKSAGVDALYCYSWGYNTFMPEVQKNGMNAQLETGIIDIMPTVGMGFDTLPWERGPGGIMDKKNLVGLLEWARDDFMPRAGRLGRRFITLDNWNEYGEGHWFFPSNYAGFDYLDAVREVFTNGGEHEDIKPTEKQKERVNHLYVQSRKVEKTFIAKSTIKKLEEGEDESAFRLVGKIDFDNGSDKAEDYPIDKQIADLRLEHGVIAGEATDGDPGFFVNDVNLKAAGIKRIKVKMKTDRSLADFQIFFVTETSAKWAEGKSFSASSPMKDDFIEFVFDTPGNSAWKDTITAFRVDPLRTTGHFEIDCIEFYDKDETSLLVLGGERQNPNRPITIVDGIMYAPCAETGALLGFKSDVTLDGKTIVMYNEDKDVHHRLEIGKDTVLIGGEAYFPLRTVAASVGYSVTWNDGGYAEVTDLESSEANVEYTPDAPGEFNFNKLNDTQGITFANISNAKVSKGLMKFAAVTNDPVMNMPFGGFKAEDYRYCNIRVKNETMGTLFQVYFTIDADTNLNETKSVKKTITASDKNFKTYCIDMSENPLWKGNIKSVRVDPSEAPGNYQIDYIVFSNEKHDEKSGSAGSAETNILTGGNIDDLSLKYTANNVKTGITSDESYIGRYSMRIEQNSDGYIAIPLDIKSNCNYNISFWEKTGNVSDVTVGAYDARGDLKNGVSKDIQIGSEWAKVTLALSDGHGDCSGIYIKPGKGTIYIDNLRVTQSVIAQKPQEEGEKFKKRDTEKTGPVKVLIIGNSITQHDRSESIGWLGSWGMAASEEKNDYVHLLKSLAEKKDRSVQLKWKNISEFEKYFYDFRTFNSSYYKEFADFDADIIICTIGANINNSANENDLNFNSGKVFTEEAYQNIINFFNPYGDAKVIVGIMPLTNYEVEEIIKSSAQNNKQILVDMSGLTGDKYTARPYSNAPVFTSDVSPAVLGHPGDAAMKEMADMLWQELSKLMDESKR